MSEEHDAGAGRDELVRLLWGPPAGPRRGPKPALTLHGIARAGIGIADAEGLPALSMQRVAEQLGKTKMSLYRYVPGRAELVAVMVENAIGGPPPAGGGGWRERLAAWARDLYAAFLRHPWLLDATVGPRLLGPVELSWMESALTALDGTGLTGAERLDAVAVLASHVRGIADQARAAAPGADTEAGLLSALDGVLHDHADRYPAFLDALATTPPGAQGQALEFGLRAFLDGLGVLIARRSGAQDPPAQPA
ncbi:TetR/AcrR family transcriptional regulator [Streptomyces sp. NPDC101118]|uniref:TetR/AcrR family transcriptional regulator n=1 Tax=Streptomyces sp. NPDC101118 TaxID=3366109 RepID=UPI0038069EA2